MGGLVYSGLSELNLQYHSPDLPEGLHPAFVVGNRQASFHIMESENGDGRAMTVVSSRFPNAESLDALFTATKRTIFKVYYPRIEMDFGLGVAVTNWNLNCSEMAGAYVVGHSVNHGEDILVVQVKDVKRYHHYIYGYDLEIKEYYNDPPF